MLVLSRRESQRIKLGDSIVVTVIKVAGDRVRLGIDAPADVLVLRGELERREAANKLYQDLACSAASPGCGQASRAAEGGCATS
jgi:carbon storage regulator